MGWSFSLSFFVHSFVCLFLSWWLGGISPCSVMQNEVPLWDTLWICDGWRREDERGICSGNRDLNECWIWEIVNPRYKSFNLTCTSMWILERPIGLFEYSVSGAVQNGSGTYAGPLTLLLHLLLLLWLYRMWVLIILNLSANLITRWSRTLGSYCYCWTADSNVHHNYIHFDHPYDFDYNQ